MFRRENLWFRQYDAEVASGVFAYLSALLLTAIVGCASTGQPRPPSLHLPSPAEKLTATRIGDQVKLAWTTPATTTDGEGIRGPITAVVCLETAPISVPQGPAGPKSAKKARKQSATPRPDATACNAVQRLTVTPGPGSATAPMAAELTSGRPTLLAYRLELQNANARSASGSPMVYIAAGAAPPAVGALTISPRREGALVQWQPVPGAAAMELKRTLVATSAGPAVAPAKPAKTPFATGASKTPAIVVTLRAEAATDAGGTLDRTAIDGSTYTYIAQRVQTVTLGGHTLELRSVASPPATFVFHDIFPPRAPTGLVSVPGGGFGELPSIDLAWDANAETDLLGYAVYRSEGASGFQKLTGEPLPAPAFRDLHVEAGHTYTYRVTAIDQRLNESAPGAVVRESLRR